MANELVKMAVDLAKGSTAEFSKEQVNESLRQKFIEINGGSDKLTYKTFRKHAPDIFEIIEEALDVLVSDYIDEQFADFVEVKNLALGDKNLFTIKQRQLFKVAKIAAGNNDLRKQRLDNGSLSVDTDWYGVALYEEFERFLAGRISWTEMVANVATSMNVKIATDIYKAIYASFTSLGAVYKKQGAFDESEFVKMAQHIQSATGAKPVVYGTLVALQKAVPSVISDNMRDKKNELGYYATVAGIDLREIKQVHEAGSDNTFAIADDFLLLVPSGSEKLVKMVIEGEALVKEVAGQDKKDDTIEYEFRKKFGIAVLNATRYGIYKLA